MTVRPRYELCDMRWGAWDQVLATASAFACGWALGCFTVPCAAGAVVVKHVHYWPAFVWFWLAVVGMFALPASGNGTWILLEVPVAVIVGSWLDVRGDTTFGLR